MRHQDLNFQRSEAKKILVKFDELYDFIRNSGLHYKISENFGCTVITVGRNFHRYSDVYKDLRAAPAALESQTDLNLNLIISELESARQEAAFLREESQLKVSKLEQELYQKDKKIEALENVQNDTSKELEKVTGELLKVKKENEEAVKNNVKNILTITGLEHKLSEAEKVNKSKSQMVEELEAGKEGLPKPVLAKIADLKVRLARAERNYETINELYKDYIKEFTKIKAELMCRIEGGEARLKAAQHETSLAKKETSDLEKRLTEMEEKLADESATAKLAKEEAKSAKKELSEMKGKVPIEHLVEFKRMEKKLADESATAKLAKEEAKNAKKELSEMERNLKGKVPSELEKKLEEVTKSLDNETKEKEKCWEVLDKESAQFMALIAEKEALIKKLAREVEKSDALAEVANTPLSSTPIKELKDDSGFEHSSIPPPSETLPKQGDVKWDLASNGLYLQHPTHNTGLEWGKPRVQRNDEDLDDKEYPNRIAACAACFRRLPPSNTCYMEDLIPDFRDYYRFYLLNFLEDCDAPWLHYGYCHTCLHTARLQNEHQVVEHAKSCAALHYVHGGNLAAIDKACKFYAETENAIRHGVNEHEAYNLIRKLLSECKGRCFLVPDMKYRKALWDLKESVPEATDTDEFQETSTKIEKCEVSETREEAVKGEESEETDLDVKHDEESDEESDEEFDEEFYGEFDGELDGESEREFWWQY